MAIQLGKKVWLHLDRVQSLGFNRKMLSGNFQFDSYEKEDDNTTCYVSERFGNGMCYLIHTHVAESFKMIPQPR